MASKKPKILDSYQGGKQNGQAAAVLDAIATEEASSSGSASQAQGISSLSAYGIPQAWIVRVKCPLPGYESLSVAYRINNRYDISRRFQAAQASTRANFDLANTLKENLPTEEAARAERLKEVRNLTEDAQQRLQEVFKIYALFVLGFDGWDFKDELTGEPIPAPNHRNPESYEVLFNRYFDLYSWCRYAGYNLALSTMFDMSVGN